ncbi:unnamed protein product, partial [Musa textilis]
LRQAVVTTPSSPATMSPPRARSWSTPGGSPRTPPCGGSPRSPARPQRFLEQEPSGDDFRYLPLDPPAAGAGHRHRPRPRGRDKIDTADKADQFSIQTMMHSTVVCKPRVCADCICSRSGKSRGDA